MVGAGTRVAPIDGLLGPVGTVAGRGTGVAREAAEPEGAEDGAGVAAADGATGGTAETDKCGCESVLPPPSDMVGASAGATEGV